MPVIKFNGQQFALQPGQNRLGGGSTADILIGDDAVQVVVDLGADGRATIWNAGSSAVKVNGMDLGQPTPLIHGDKVEIAGTEVYFADDAKGGSTQFVSAADVAAIANAKRTGPARGTLATGGRLVSLVDGKEYAVPDTGITIGRDASAEIVVAQTAVSRRHAQVIPSANGYVVNDLSTNGVFVNGAKVASGHSLSRADVIRVGTEEFRFYADLAPMSKPAAAASTPAPAAAPPAPPKPSPNLAPTPPARPATPPPAAAAPPAPPAPRPAAPAAAATPPARPATPPPAKPAAPSGPAAVQASKNPTPASTPAVPRPAPPKPVRAEPVTTKKAIPIWAVALVIVAAAAVAAYFYMQQP